MRIAGYIIKVVRKGRKRVWSWANRAFKSISAMIRPGMQYDKYISDYKSIVNRLIAEHGLEEGVLRAVGGADQFGDFQLAQLAYAGLTGDSYLIDVGCGSGRLTRRAARSLGLRYMGTDINSVLLDYAKNTAQRPDFRFELVNHPVIPERDGVADIIAMYSVVTHILHEDSFCYMQEARRVLKPSGRLVFSFLDLNISSCRDVFLSKVRQARDGQMREHFDIFIGRGDIPIWAMMLDMKLVEIIPGDENRLYDSANLTAFGVAPLSFLLGQTTVILEKT